MPLPDKNTFSQQIQGLIKSNDNPEDKDKAIKEFADGLADLLLINLKAADVVLLSGSINTVVTTTAGTGSGVNLIPANGKLK